MRTGEVHVDVGDRLRVAQGFRQLPRPLQELDRFPVLGAIVVIAAHQRGRQRQRIGLRLRVELDQRFLEVSKSARITDRDVRVAHLDLERGARCGSGGEAKRALVALYSRYDHPSR